MTDTTDAIERSITKRIDSITHIDDEHLGTRIPAPKSVKIELTARCNYRCLRGDTLVDTVAGPVAIRDLVGRDKVPVYTYKDDRVFIAEAVNIRKYGEREQLVRVNFDDGTHIDCTPDHKVLTFKSRGQEAGTDETAVEAQHLKPGDRLRAMRLAPDGGGYMTVAAGRFFRQKRYRMLMEYHLGRTLERSEVVHHKDHDKTNDTIENLELLDSHAAHAAQHPEVAERMRLNNPARNMTPEWRAKIGKAVTGKKRTLEQRLRYRESKLGAKNPRYKDGASQHASRIAEINHKVVSVEWLAERDDVYCLDVPASGWFFANKVLVKNCSFCALAERENQPTKDMDRALFSKMVKEMAAAGVKEIGLFYIGESFLNIDLTEFACREAKAAGIEYCFLTTNGSLATPDKVERLMKAGLNSLKFSMTTADDEQFEQVIGAPRAMRHKAIENLKAARKVRDAGGYNCGIYASSIKYDDDQMVKAQAVADDIRPYVDEHYWLPLYSFGSLAIDAQKETGLTGTTPGNMGRIGGLVTPIPCWCAFSEGHILYDGRMTLCGFDNGEGHWVCGDLNTQSFMEAWNSKTALELRAAHLRRKIQGTVCETCAMYGGRKA